MPLFSKLAVPLGKLAGTQSESAYEPSSAARLPGQSSQHAAHAHPGGDSPTGCDGKDASWSARGFMAHEQAHFALSPSYRARAQKPRPINTTVPTPPPTDSPTVPPTPVPRFRRMRSASVGPLEVYDSGTEDNSTRQRSAVRRNSISSAQPDSPCAGQHPVLVPQRPYVQVNMSHGEEEVLSMLRAAISSSDTAALVRAVDAHLGLPADARTTAGSNGMLETLHTVRGQVPHMLRIYRTMEGAGLVPNQRTYTVLVDALCTRAMEGAASERAPDEDDLVHALVLTHAAHDHHFPLPSIAAYNQLLACCASRGKTGEAVEALALLEENVLVTKDADSYRLLVEVFATESQQAYSDEPVAERTARCLEACKLVFETFERVAHAMAVIQPHNESFGRARNLRVWSAMLDAHFTLSDAAGAVALFERMLAAQPYAVATPPVDEQVTSTMVLGFVRAGDVRCAVQWLHQLQASMLPQPTGHALEGVLAAAMHPPPAEAVVLLRPIAETLLVREPLPTAAAAKCVQHLASSLEKRKVWKQVADEELVACLDVLAPLAERIFSIYSDKKPLKTKVQMLPVSAVLRLVGQLTFLGRPEDAARFLRLAVRALRFADTNGPGCVALLCDACHLPMAIADAALHQPCALSDACVRLKAMATLVAPALVGMRGSPLDAYHAAVVRLYEAASRDLDGDLRPLQLDEYAWQHVTDAFCAEECVAPESDTLSTTTGLGRLLVELARLPTDAQAPARRPALDVARLEKLLAPKYGAQGMALLQPWLAPGTSVPVVHPPRAAATTAPGTSVAVAAVSEPRALHAFIDGVASPSLPPVRSLDPQLASALQGLARAHGQLQADELYARLKSSVGRGIYVPPGALAVLINAYGRMSQTARIDELYGMGMHVLASRASEREWRVTHWVQLEDGMVTALSHASLGERANAHRERLIAAGHVPSASAYAALIATIQERTDDAVVAEELFGESQRLGVRPTTYLYNTVISKLSRARKAEQALRLFDAMRSANLRPSSVTYGAAINACVRTGDEARATQLFAEMESQQSFQPRVPPYNTMIQYYVHNCMDRTKALHYYEKMQQAGVRPSAHTYKLLLDLWGSIPPVQPDRQQSVFARLVADRLVGVQGTHWASLLHTQGTVLGDLDRALETFESIAEHASGPRPGAGASTVPDAVVYESLFSVFVAHGRTDLMPAYLTRMVHQGILPTAYIANLLIKGYAQDGPLGLVEARRVFEAMIDPPAGIAAAGNHLPRHHGAGALGLHRERVAHGARSHSVDRTNVLGALVNREPSTYEAMIRAELAFGNQDRAQQLFERMKARAFPAALIHRARAMFDHVGPRHAAAAS